jgi:hypothetical protein
MMMNSSMHDSVINDAVRKMCALTLLPDNVARASVLSDKQPGY